MDEDMMECFCVRGESVRNFKMISKNEIAYIRQTARNEANKKRNKKKIKGFTNGSLRSFL
jgi:hypothetical protein